MDALCRHTLAVLAISLIPLTTAAAELDPNNARDVLQINRKVMCSTEDGDARTYWWHGKAFSRRMGERP